jgi:hypothetical protein
LTEGEVADLVFTDPLYNVRIDGHASGLGRTSQLSADALGCDQRQATAQERITYNLTARRAVQKNIGQHLHWFDRWVHRE